MLRNRLYSNSGATLVLALIFFLLCAVAGSVILVSGSAAAGRLADLKDDQQAYYSTTSAAKVLKSELTNRQYLKDTGNLNTGSPVSALDGLISAGIKSTGDTYSVSGCTMNSGEIKELDVTFDFMMETNNNITINIKKHGDEGHVDYQCTLKATSNSPAPNIVEWPEENIEINALR